jgi:8-oxo-dGTP pyrophosphatase MutT (NUDIX family)
MPNGIGAQDQLTDPAAPMTPAAEALRRYIVEHLDPLYTADQPTPFRSDRDLNPEMVFPALVDGYQPAAVLIGLVERDEGVSVLLTRRADTLRRHAGQIAFPGGRSDPGEAPWQTALREAEEEIGLRPDQVTLAGLSTPFRVQTGYHVTPVVGFVRADFQPVSNPAEVAEVFETPFAFLMDPANHERRRRDQPGPPRWHYAMTHGDRVIWGATAGMLKALYDRLWGAADV